MEAARAYYQEHWTLCAPRSATALDRPVGQWLSNLRRAGALEGHPEWESSSRAVKSSKPSSTSSFGREDRFPGRG
ncbi:helicase associated domain-containing protein [Streptomyces mirabilis]|uniref:helicase associated domain-containing protein n=1 Tax=Streptomyces mirabilis TaxID=68239 RepID=UPI00368617AF